MIEVYDELYTDDFLVKLHALSRDLPWGYGNTANRYQYPQDSILGKGSHVFFGRRIYQKHSPYRIHNHAPDEFIDVLENFVFKIIKDNSLELQGIDINLQLLGQDGTVHRDFYNNPQDRTIMFYPHYKWDESWGGAFQVLDNQDNIIDEYFPMPGRIIYFDSTVLHRALAPTIANIPRISVAFRMNKVENNS